jgi:photosystem II stability/assembly factor-like uncharacterized protein
VYLVGCGLLLASLSSATVLAAGVPQGQAEDSPYLNVWVHHDYMVGPGYSNAPDPAAMAAAASASASALESWVTDVNPRSLANGTLYGGRVNALAVDPANAQIVFAGTELGGVFESTDGAAHWMHVDGLPLFRINDVKFVSTHPDVIVVAGDSDGRVMSQGGVWRSVNGGTTWKHAADWQPECTDEPAAHRIAVASGSDGRPLIFVADDCGIATSKDLGATWTELSPEPAKAARYWDVSATNVRGLVQLDACGDDGYFRSSDAGLPGSWSPPDQATPYLDQSNYDSVDFPRCRVAVAPPDPNTVYLASDAGGAEGLWETTSTSVPRSWIALNPVPAFDDNAFGRPSFLETHAGLDGDPTHFEVYFGGSSRFTEHQTCSTLTLPRCQAGTGWGPVDSSLEFAGRVNTDAAAIAFDPSKPDGCPLYWAGDAGVFTTSDGCDQDPIDALPIWTQANVGLDALWVFPRSVGGTAYPDHTTLSIGMQDNGLDTSSDDGGSWQQLVGGTDVYGLVSDPVGPGSLVYLQSTGTGEDALQGLITGPPTTETDPFGQLFYAEGSFTQFGPHSYAVITTSNDADGVAGTHLWVTTNQGASWTQMGPNIPGARFPQAIGAAQAPNFYYESYVAADGTVDGKLHLYKLSGPLDPTATLTSIGEHGLTALDPSAFSTFDSTGLFAVNPDNPNQIYASDTGAGQMMVTNDGGSNWQPDTQLTNLITHDSEFRYSDQHLLGNSVADIPLQTGNCCIAGQPRAIAFDPSGQTIVLGTVNAGIFASPDDGKTWTEIPGSEQIPRAAGFFFDKRTGAIYVGSEGRGLWRITIPGRTRG